MKLYAILCEVGSEYYTLSPIFISLNLNLVKEKLQKSGPFGSHYLDPDCKKCCIAYIDLDPNLIYNTCNFEVDDLVINFHLILKVLLQKKKFLKDNIQKEKFGGQQ